MVIEEYTINGRVFSTMVISDAMSELDCCGDECPPRARSIYEKTMVGTNLNNKDIEFLSQPEYFDILVEMEGFFNEQHQL